MIKKSHEVFERTLLEQTRVLREAAEKFLVAFLSANPNDRELTAATAYDAADRLFKMLHDDDRPGWLVQLRKDLRIVSVGPKTTGAISSARRIATDLVKPLLEHEWAFGDEFTEIGFDFDSVFDKYREQGRIPELFDQLVSALTEIVASEQIDSIRVISDLNNLIATLRNARNGSYFATRGAWYLVTTWFANTGWELLGDIPVLGAAVRGLRTTMDETDARMQKLHEEIQAEFESRIENFPKLRYEKPLLQAASTEDTARQSDNEDSADTK